MRGIVALSVVFISIVLVVQCFAYFPDAPGTMTNTTYPEPTYTPILYGIIGNATLEHLVTVDQNMGQATEVGIINATSVHGLAYDRSGDTLYSIANCTTDPELIIINRTTAEATTVGPLDLAGYDPDFLKIAESIAFNPLDGILYGCAGPEVSYSNLLVRIDPATGIATLIAPLTGTTENDGDSMVFINETLYLIDTSAYGSFMYTVNLSSGVATTIGPISDYYLHVVLAYNPETQRLFGTAPQNWLLIEISPSTGQATAIGQTHHWPEDFEGNQLHTIGVAYDLEIFTASISPVSSSTVIGNSVTFTSTVSGGTTPYSYQWYLDDTPVSGAELASWTFTPTTLGNYIVQLNVTDSLANIAESNIANVTVDAAVHDVAITNVKTSKDGCTPMPTVGNDSFVRVNVTVFNGGNLPETFNVTLYAISTVVGTLTVSGLEAGAQTVLAFTWNVAGWGYGDYVISAYAVPVLGETNIADNTYTGSAVRVVIPGDLNGNGVVDIFDAILLSNAYLSTPGRPNWNPNADLRADDIIDIFDAIILAGHFNQHYP